VVAAIGAASPGAFASSSRSAAIFASLLQQEGVKQAAKSVAAPFDLADVRLLEGPFRSAQQRDARYLLQLEPDRLLQNFRVNAGLKAKARVYGGWESVEPGSPYVATGIRSAIICRPVR
jgi:hypothetical protein